MPRMLAAGAAVTLCLALGAMQAAGQEAEPSSSPAAGGPDQLGARFRVDLWRPVGLEGLTVVGRVGSRRGAGPGEIFRGTLDHVDPAAALVDIRLPAGVHNLTLTADESPCQLLSDSACEGVHPGRLPARMCFMEFNLRQGDDVSVVLSDVPAVSEERFSGCPVGALVLSPVYEQ